MPKPAKCISPKKAKKLQEKYIKTIEKALKKEFGKEQCRDFWWPLEEIEEYIAYVKSETKDKDYKNLGLRFFLGKYEDDENDGSATMFIAPTGTKETAISAMKVGTETIEEVDPLNMNQGGWPPKDY
ncbi:hypothetical protein OOZ15_16200 [Galbibacter sp. EGI 63066]|uniref:hypothetical protein n=1 Tax=Galbibacter sp. EGI 63066 TaxID=2993559 RepID=UPI0022488694|nr:hypothetical protein [Galbibacter sp. EGI 63066]MCX2681496.1 hypothetical protein [Galbibacter sp. EGI 63066]